MKIVFLDIDGALNKKELDSKSDKSDIIRHNDYGRMNRSLVEQLNEFTRENDASIVISSKWRCETLEENKTMLSLFGITGNIIGHTPQLGNYSVRGNEIRAWLLENEFLLGCSHQNFKQYIILDDESDMLLEHAHHFIHLDPCAGFSDIARYRATRRMQMLRNIPDA